MPDSDHDKQAEAAREAGLVFGLESPLPASLPVGQASAVFCAGACFHHEQTVTGLELLLDGTPRRPLAVRMPRPDLVGAAPGRGSPARRRYRSGFWSILPIEARERPGRVAIDAAVDLADGTRWVVPLGRIDVVAPPPAPPAPPVPIAPDLIAVCLATYEPDPELLRIQVESLRAQTDDRWICLLSDDGSSAPAWSRILDVVGDDPRFVVSQAPRRQGFYRNFERALTMVPAEAPLVALCDQDDRWYPEKLAVLRDALGSSRLVYSDQRLVDRHGTVLRETMWRGRANNHTNLASMLIANTITGAATLLRREVVQLALPFPDTPGLQFHDHWLGLVALAAGDIAYVDRPLYDYVQHAGAVFGEVDGSAPESARRPAAGRGSAGWRAAYFCGYLAREQQAETLLLRCASTLTPRKSRALRRFGASVRSPTALVWLAARPLRCLLGRTETLGSEAGLARGVLWRWLIGPAATASTWLGSFSADAAFPDPLAFQQKRLRRWRSRA